MRNIMIPNTLISTLCSSEYENLRKYQNLRNFKPYCCLKCNEKLEVKEKFLKCPNCDYYSDMVHGNFIDEDKPIFKKYNFEEIDSKILLRIGFKLPNSFNYMITIPRSNNIRDVYVYRLCEYSFYESEYLETIDEIIKFQICNPEIILKKDFIGIEKPFKNNISLGMYMKYFEEIFDLPEWLSYDDVVMQIKEKK